MSENKTIVVRVKSDDNSEVIGRRELIRGILSRGNHVRFTNSWTGIKKDVSEWNEDDHGDLEAFRTSKQAVSKFVCWRHTDYDISEIEPTTDTEL